MIFDSDDFLLGKKNVQKKQIRKVIALEHKKRHHNHENELENLEKILIEQMIQHCKSFENDFKKVAKGDWVDSAISELNEINKSLKNVMD